MTKIDCEVKDCSWCEDGVCENDEVEIGHHPNCEQPCCYSYEKEKDNDQKK